MAGSLQATARPLFPFVILSAAFALCAACSGSNQPGSAIPSSASASRNVHRLSQAGVVVDPSAVGAQVSSAVLGADMEDWFDITQPNLAAAFVQAGMTTTRWPGGKGADRYHWKKNRNGPGVCAGTEQPSPNSSFDNFMQDVVIPAHLDVSITVNYGSNLHCTGGAGLGEAAQWVKYANVTKGYNVTWWTIGNEQYVTGSLDLRSAPHDPAQYAQVVSQDYYQQMKAASPLVPINVCIDASIRQASWNTVVFSQAPFDCIELHYYPQKGTSVNDTFLLTNGVQGITSSIKAVEAQLATAGKAGTPIFVGEIGSALPPGDKQNMSITQALYAGQVIGEMLNDGVARATWHSGFGGCETPAKGGDFSPSLYGWQDFGGTMIFSVGTVAHHCSTKNVPVGTLMPTADAFEVASHFVRSGEHMLGVSVLGMKNVRAYATTYNGGYALMLFNLSEKSSVNVPVTINGKASGTGGPLWKYDKKLYDASKRNKWKGPGTGTLPSWQNAFTLKLRPWSMTVVQTQ